MVRMFLVTANVGSVFENLEQGLDVWMNEFISVIRTKDPEFVGIHFQETGGKNYTNGSDVVATFFGNLVERMGQLNFVRGEGFIDSRSDLEDQFTALSNVYFVHESVPVDAVRIWDFQEKSFKALDSQKVTLHSGRELDAVNNKEKEKFPQNFYPNCKWSRKGFIRCRWRISGQTLDFVNIHLFHDSDNVEAASSFPSEFSQSRQRALSYTIDRLQDNAEKFPLFIFGDFNFRLNTHGVLNQLTREGVTSVSLGTKHFDLPELEGRFLHGYQWLKQYDFEGQCHQTQLTEADLNFHPTYPFEEEEHCAEMFMRTRCPAWCDRVLFTHSTKRIMAGELPTEYNVLGSRSCMGDHKPVYLTFTLAVSPVWTQNSNKSPPLPPGACLSSGYRMTLTPNEVNACRRSRRRQGSGCFGNIFGLRNLNLGLTTCPKKSSLASDSVSINPPSSSVVSYEGETSSTSCDTGCSPTHSRANTIRRTVDKRKKPRFPRNLFCRRQSEQEGVAQVKGDNIANNRIILPLLITEKDKAGVEDARIRTDSRKSDRFASFFDNPNSQDKRGKESSRDKDDGCCKCVIF